MAGNVWEMTRTVRNSSLNQGWSDYSQSIDFNSLFIPWAKPSGVHKGMGLFVTNSFTGYRALYRGGFWGVGVPERVDGLFTLAGHLQLSNTYDNFGFRCVYQP